MKFLANLFGAGASELMDGVGGLIGKFKAAPEEKMAFQLELKKLIADRDQRNLELINAEVDAKARIMEAEIKQGDNYTKRARPTIIYMGLLLVLLQAAVSIFGGPKIEIPVEFWYGWTGIVSVYSLGRTMEKRGNGSKAASMITGGKSLLD